jgi:hypothetical protein
MLQRRTLLSGLACAGIGAGVLGVGSSARAQRATHPIARPPSRRPDGSIILGGFDASGGVASGALPGVFVVMAVDSRAETLQLRGEGGRTGLVHVNADEVDLDSLKTGDEVEVDFLVPQPGATRLEAATLWKVER